MAKQIKIKHWKVDKDVYVSIEPYVLHLDHEKQESAQWQLESDDASGFSIEFVDTSPFADDRNKFDHTSATSTKVVPRDKKRHKYNIVVDGVTIDPIIVVRPPD